MESRTKKGAALLRRATTPEEERREAARILGSIRTPKKAAASRANGFKPGNAVGGRPPVPLLEIPCACTAGESLEGHHWKCPRGQAVKRRIAQGKDPMTGAPLAAQAQP